MTVQQRGYPFPSALQTPAGQQWWIRYASARAVYERVVEPGHRHHVPFERAPQGFRAERPAHVRLHYESDEDADPNAQSDTVGRCFVEDAEAADPPREATDPPGGRRGRPPHR